MDSLEVRWSAQDGVSDFLHQEGPAPPTVNSDAPLCLSLSAPWTWATECQPASGMKRRGGLRLRDTEPLEGRDQAFTDFPQVLLPGQTPRCGGQGHLWAGELGEASRDLAFTSGWG